MGGWSKLFSKAVTDGEDRSPIYTGKEDGLECEYIWYSP